MGTLLAITLKDTFGYRLLVLLHILAVIVAFAPAFVWPLIGRRASKAATGAPGAATAGTASTASTASAASTGSTPGGVVARVLNPVVHGGALILAGLFGILLVVSSSSYYKFSQSWASIAFLLWFLMLGVYFLGLWPLERRLATADLPSERRVALEQRLSMFYGALHLLLLLQVIDMIWQPGVH